MAADLELQVKGLDQLRDMLRGLPPKLRLRALRNALSAGARIVRDEAKRRAPTLKTTTRSGASALKRGVRKVGTVRDAISVRTSKQSRRRGDVGVFVNVRPAKRADRGAKSPRDPFYWRFINFGWKSKPTGAGFLEAGARRLGEALRKFEQVLGPQIQKLNDGGKRP